MIDFKASADVELDIGDEDSERETDALRERVSEWLMERAATFPIGLDAATQSSRDLGGPSTGRVWVVRRIMVTDTMPTSSTAPTADVFLFAGQLGMLTGTQLLWAFSTMPAQQTFGKDEVVITNPDHLIVVQTQAASPVALAGNVSVIDRPYSELPYSLRHGLRPRMKHDDS